METNNKFYQTAQMITLIVLSLAWIGYGYALYQGNKTNISNYHILILVFSLFNSKVIFTRKKAVNQFFNIIAKINGLIFFIGVVITIILLILK